MCQPVVQCLCPHSPLYEQLWPGTIVPGERVRTLAWALLVQLSFHRGLTSLTCRGTAKFACQVAALTEILVKGRTLVDRVTGHCHSLLDDPG